MIITCHIFQYLGNELAWWFNVGVQIFLCISGYLYGQKPIGEIKSFYQRRIYKILIPFYIILIPAILLNLVSGNVGLAQAVSALLMHSTFTGARHLWFVSTILICYVITPILESFFRRANKKQYIATTIIAVEIATLFFYGFADFYNGAWISCYILGYSLGFNERNQFFTKRVMMIIFGVLAALNIPQIYVDYIRIASFSGSIKNLYNILCDYNHVWLGIFLFLTMKSIFDRIEPAIAVKKGLDIADKYSYEAYLVHHFLILGSFSLMGLTPNLAANIFIVLIEIAVLSWLVKRIEIIIMKVLP